MSPGAVGQATAGVAFLLASAQAAGDAAVPVPEWMLGWVELVVVALVGMVWWSVRKINTDHEKRIAKIENVAATFAAKESKDVETLRETITDLRLTVAELKAVCPFCNGTATRKDVP